MEVCYMNNELTNLIVTLKEYLLSLSAKPESINWLPYLSTALATAVSIFTIIYASKNTRYSIRKSNDSKLCDRYQRQLEEFYYPFLLITKRNATMYDVFARNEKEEQKKQNAVFSTLVYLIDGHTFLGNDKAILNAIINNDNKLNDLIMQNSRHIESSTLRGLLSSASVHFTLMKLAYDEKLNNNTRDFESYTYPKDLADTIMQEIDSIEKKIHALDI
jgi:hypothetical protein